MDWPLYIKLSVMIFLEFAIWGAWSPVLAARLLGPLKMSGKQTGWIYATIPLAAIISPLIAGQIVDRWLATQWFLAGAHLVGGILLLVAARKKVFGVLFATMGLYALLFAPTLAFVNSLTFSNLGDTENPLKILVWAPIAWVLVGWLLAAWRRLGKPKVQGSDALTLAGILSLAMGAFCFFLPHTAPKGSPDAVLPFIKAFSMLGDTNFLIFVVISFVVASQLQFYFLGTARFLEDIGVQNKNVPAVMTIAQVAEVTATGLLALIAAAFFDTTKYYWIFAIGVAGWLVMYLIYAMKQPRWLVIISMAMHGLAYTCFFRIGWIYVDKVAPSDIRNSAQALIITATFGFGFFFGTQFTGVIMDKFKKEGTFQWRPIFLVPCVLTAACVIAFILFFKG